MSERSKIVTRCFVILKEEGRIPEKKGPWTSQEAMLAFIREAIDALPVTASIAAVRQIWNDDFRVDDGRELIAIEDALTAAA